MWQGLPTKSRAAEGPPRALSLLLTLQWLRAPGLHTHALRVARLAYEVAALLGVSAFQRQVIAQAAVLHDIGKLIWPDTLLHKPGPPTAAEWELIRQHPEMGSYLLHRAGEQAALLIPLVGSHHERWDGHGYPRRLKGEQIPLGARIIGASDAYDAMTSSRPYQERLSVHAARVELHRGANQHFDPQVVTMLLQALRG